MKAVFEALDFDTAAHVLAFKALVAQSSSLQDMRRAFETYALGSPLLSGTTITAIEAPSGVWIGNPAHATKNRGVYLHGGGYVAGSVRMYAGLVSRLAEATQSWIFMPDIPLAPERQFPAAHESAIAACRYAGNNAPTMTEKAATLFVAGDSCGAAVAMAIGMRLRDAPEANPLTAIVGLSPTLDMTAGGDSYNRFAQTDLVISREITQHCIATYAPHEDPSNPLLSPVFGRFAGLPPVLLQVSDDEAVFDDSMLAASRARQQGAPIEVQVWRKLPHVWHLLGPQLREATSAIQCVGEFIRRTHGL